MCVSMCRRYVRIFCVVYRAGKTQAFLKKPNPLVFLGVLLFFKIRESYNVAHTTIALPCKMIHIFLLQIQIVILSNNPETQHLKPIC